MSLFYTIDEAAEAMRVTKATIRHWLAHKKLRGFKPGRRVLIRVDDLQALIDASEVTEQRARRAKDARAAVKAVSS